MKNFKLIIVAVIALASMNATAGDFAKSYNRVTAGYSGLKFSQKVSSFKSEKSQNFDGLALTYIHGFNLTESAPLYLEVGGRYNINVWEDKSEIDGVLTDYDINLLSVAIPVNLSYRIAVSDKVSIAPYGGFHMKVNIMGEAHHKVEYDGKTVSSEKINFFDGDDDEKAKRVQAGYQVGVGLNIRHFYVGGGLYGDLSNYGTDLKAHGFEVNLGYTW